jgi:polar amino acid transport system substrate-binding protein
MSRYWSVLLGCCLNLLIFMAQAESYLEQDKAVRFAVIYTDEPPYAYSNQMSEYNGIVPKLVEALGRELGFEVEYLPTSRKRLEASVISRKADFTWLSQAFHISDKPEDWVRDKTICVYQNYIYPMLTPFFNQQIAKPITVSSESQITALFLRRKCDLLYTNEYRANWAFQTLSSEIKIFRSLQPLAQTYESLMFNKSWKSEMPKINQAIAKIKDSGELKEIIDVQIQSKSIVF